MGDLRYSIDLPSPAALTLLRHAQVIADECRGDDDVVIVDWELTELPG